MTVSLLEYYKYVMNLEEMPVMHGYVGGGWSASALYNK
jgi:hypothetical protein